MKVTYYVFLPDTRTNRVVATLHGHVIMHRTGKYITVNCPFDWGATRSIQDAAHMAGTLAQLASDHFGYEV